MNLSPDLHATRRRSELRAYAKRADQQNAAEGFMRAEAARRQRAERWAWLAALAVAVFFLAMVG